MYLVYEGLGKGPQGNQTKGNIMKKYLDLLLEEKGIDREQVFEVEGDFGTNFIPLEVVLEHILITTKREQHQIKNTLVKIDFHNGDVCHFFKHLAQALAK